jgi:hypothetical protein
MSKMLASKPQTHNSGLRYFVVFSSAVALQTNEWQTFMMISPPF